MLNHPHLCEPYSDAPKRFTWYERDGEIYIVDSQFPHDMGLWPSYAKQKPEGRAAMLNWIDGQVAKSEAMKRGQAA